MKKTLLLTFTLLSFLFGAHAQQFSCSNGTDSVVYDISPTDLTCANFCDGSAFIQVSSGNADYVQWQGPNGFSQSGLNMTTVNGLCPGTYTVVVNDFTSGIACTGHFVINSPSFLIVAGTAINETAPGANDGSVIATATGGTPGYIYDLYLNGNIIATNGSGNFTGLTPGNYMVCATDVNGCQFCENNLLVQTSCNFVSTVNSIDEVCSGSCDGAIFLTTSGGTAPYMATIDGGATWITYTSTYPFQNLCSGTYVIQIMDANGCTDMITAVIGSGSTFQAHVQVDANDTSANCTGALSAYTTGSPGTIVSYEWIDCNSGNSINTTPSINGLCAGAYQVAITNSNGCVDTSSCDSVLAVNGGCNIVANIDPFDEVCFGSCDGNILVSIAGGTAPYTVILDGTITLMASTTAHFNSLCPGTYQIEIIDAVGCTVTYAPITISTLSFLNLSQTGSTNESAPGAGDGSLSFTATGGTPNYIYTLGGTTSTTGNFTNLSTGWYNVCVQDVAGCQVCDSAYVGLDTTSCNLNAVSTSANTSCDGICDGLIVVDVFNGTAPFTYILDGTVTVMGGSSGTFANVCYGPHTIDVIDANGCSIAVTAFVWANQNVTVNHLGATNETAPGASDGSLIFSGSGGISPYTFTLTDNGGSTSNTTGSFSGLSAGWYEICAVDSIGCESCDSAYVGVNNGSCNLAANPTVQPESCPGSCDGVIIVDIIGGTLPYIVTLNGTITQTVTSAAFFSNICSGVHQIEIIDGNGCTFMLPITVWSNSNLTMAQTGMTNESSFGANDGTLSFTATGGTAPYTYNLNGTNNTTGNFANLSTGWYSICVEDVAGCEVCDSAYVGLDTTTCNLVGTALPYGESCPGSCDGAIQIDITGGTLPYIVTLNGTVSQTATSVAYFSNICSGVYQVDIVDANGCSFFIPAVTVWSNSNLSLTQTGMTNESSSGTNDGTLSFTASGGASPYTYNLGGTTNTSGNFGNLSTGWYSICVNDTLGCQVCDSAYVGLDSAVCNLQGTYTHQDNLCPSTCSGSITAIGVGGSGTYEYSLDGISWGTANTFYSLCAGVYVIYIRDVNDHNCMTFQTIQIVNLNNFSAQPFVVQNSNGNCTGEVDVTISNGVGPFVVEWYDCANGNLVGTGSSSLGNLCAGSYFAMVIDQGLGNCIDTTSCVTLVDSGSAPCNINITTYVTNSPSNGQCNGGLNAVITGVSSNYNAYWIDCATGNIAYTWYQWPAACPGSYALVVQDFGTGCSDTSDCINLLDSTSNCNHLVAENIVHASCGGACDGMIVLTSNGPNPSYLWNNGATGSTLTGLCPGNYCVTVVYSDSCTQTYCYTVGSNSTLSMSVQVNNETSSGAANGLIVVDVTGGTPDYEYSINGGTYSLGSSTHTIGNLSAGFYWVCVRDSLGCEICDSVQVGVGTGIATQSTFDVDIYPNPNNGSFTIELPDNLTGNSQIQLMDVSGRLIWQTRTSETRTQVNLGDRNLSKGVYFINITNNNRRADQRIVIH